MDLLFVWIDRVPSVHYFRVGCSGSVITGAAIADMAFKATEESLHGWVPTCLASWLTVS